MKQLRPFLAPTALAAGIILAFAYGLLLYQGFVIGRDVNMRLVRLEKLGGEATSFAGARLDGENLLFRARPNHRAYAEWKLAPYAFSRLLEQKPEYRLALFIVGTDIVGSKPTARVTVSFNGHSVASFVTGARASNNFIVPQGGYVPGSLKVEQIQLSPLYQPLGIRFPIRGCYDCGTKSWTIRISVEGVDWTVQRLGLALRYSPRPVTLWSNWFDVALGGAVLFGVLAILVAALRAVERVAGWTGFLSAVPLACFALVTHDQWDFPAWLYYGDLMAFGHGNSAMMWAGTPLWAWVCGAMALVTRAFFVVSGDGSTAVTAIVLKLLLVSAYLIATSVAVASFEKGARPRLFALWCLAPGGLYEVLGGYRECLAVGLVAVGFVLARRESRLGATLTFAAAGSISETVLPFTILPAATILANQGIRALPRALALIAAGLGAVALEWISLPHFATSSSLGFRVARERYGGASWQGVLHGLNLLPAKLEENGLLVMGALFLILTLPLLVVYVRHVGRSSVSDAERNRRIELLVLGLVAAFFLSYRAVDHANWYALIGSSAIVLWRRDRENPLPYVLSTLVGVALYIVLGAADFADWNYVWPQDHGVWGILGNQMYVAAGAVILCIVCLYIGTVTDRWSTMFSPFSPLVLIASFLAFAAASIRDNPLDVVMVIAAGVATVAGFIMLFEDRAAHNPWRPWMVLRFAAPLIVTALMLRWGQASSAVVIGGVCLAQLTVLGSVGFVDLALCFSSLSVLTLQHGEGGLAQFALLCLIILAVCTPLISKIISFETPRLGADPVIHSGT